MAANVESTVAPLPFGIPQLDHMLGYPDIGSVAAEGCITTPTSLAIVGSDGTGKSVFALHIASAYFALMDYVFRKNKFPKDNLPKTFPLVFYVSSDLRSAAARKIWENFYLDYPWNRYTPFLGEKDIQLRREQLKPRLRTFHVNLETCGPDPSGMVARVNKSLKPRTKAADDALVSFLDLATHTTGDDWLFVGRLLASLPRPIAAPPHLLILDSVAGFETMVGERNRFGERMSRRARVAQMLRAAGDNWHTVFVVEEPPEGDHLPEEYVTDTVLHLRRYGAGAHTRRVLEIEKSRARSFGVGEHPFEIRDGRGTSTGSWENPDDPNTRVYPDFWKKAAINKGRARHNAYVQVFPSLHYLSREFARKRVLRRDPITAPVQQDATTSEFPSERPNAQPSSSHIPFNIDYLDDMLAIGKAPGDRGLPGGSTTALIGDEGTRKATLAEHFLAQAFADFPVILQQALSVIHGYQAESQRKPFDEYLDLEWRSRKADSSANSAKSRAEVRFWRQIEGAHEKQMSHYGKNLEDLAKGTWRLKTEAELKEDVEAPDGHPLMTRWDTTFYYKALNEGETVSDEIKTFILAISLLRIPWGFLPAVVFVSTHDTSSDVISARIMKHYQEELRRILENRCGLKPKELVDALPAIKRLLEWFIVVRRVELVDATAPQLWHIIHSVISHALYLVGHSIKAVLAATTPLEYASDVRVVISDLRLVRDTYPAVADDPLFLPTLAFRLRRLGVTTLIVDSDSGRPDQLPSHPMNGVLRSLVDHQVFTWKVPFFGEQRVAIAVIPAMNPSLQGVIRELCHERTGQKLEDESVTVDPHFELYMGLEEGKPTAIPLQVILYEETKAFADYIESESKLLSRVFSPLPGNQPVIQVQRTSEYDGLRDYCHLPVKTHLPFTLVFMIDGYWALDRRNQNSLRSQRDYLFRPFAETPPADTAFVDHDDVFRLFKKTLSQIPSRSGEGTNQYTELVYNKRVDFFSQPDPDSNAFFYKTRLAGTPKDVDRVPFMWDFGFLVCSEHQWNTAAAIKIDAPDPRDKSKENTVGKVWQRLQRLAALEIRPDDSSRNTPKHIDHRTTLDVKAILSAPCLQKGHAYNVTWREFLEASVAVAEAEQRRTEQKVLAFDLAMSRPESFSCWLIEVWFSEIVSDALVLLENERILRRHGCADLADASKRWAQRVFDRLAMFSKSEYEGDSRQSRVYLQTWLRGDNEDLVSRPGSILEKFTAVRDSWKKSPTNGENSEIVRVRQIASQIVEMPGYSLQLYKTWLLLLESIEFTLYQDPDQRFSLKTDFQPSVTAVSTRHWYKTACASGETDRARHGNESVVRTKVPVRLPGHFTTRGDWFLAVAQGSRSSRLADLALDMLTSRRANRTRLHLGMGLPTRDLLNDSRIRNIRTGLTVSTPDAVHYVSYGDLLDLAGTFAREIQPRDQKPRATNVDRSSYFWFYRSGFRDYDRQAIAIQRWIHRMMSWTVRYRDLHRETWRHRTGFKTYDEISEGNLENLVNYRSFLEFASALDTFAADLDHCSLDY